MHYQAAITTNRNGWPQEGGGSATRAWAYSLSLMPFPFYALTLRPEGTGGVIMQFGKHLCSGLHALLILSATTLYTSLAHGAVAYDEAILGDIDTPPVADPANLVGPIIHLSVGVNEILGEQSFSGVAGNFATYTTDFDTLRFVVPDGTELVAASVAIVAGPTSGPVSNAGLNRCYLTNSSVFGVANFIEVQGGLPSACADFYSGVVPLWTSSLPLASGTYGYDQGVFASSASSGVYFSASWDYTLSLTVQPSDPSVLLAQLRDSVTGLGPGTSLADKVARAQDSYDVSDVPATCAALADFLNQVSAQTGKKLGPEAASRLTGDAQVIMAAISCP